MRTIPWVGLLLEIDFWADIPRILRLYNYSVIFDFDTYKLTNEKKANGNQNSIFNQNVLQDVSEIIIIFEGSFQIFKKYFNKFLKSPIFLFKNYLIYIVQTIVNPTTRYFIIYSIL